MNAAPGHIGGDLHQIDASIEGTKAYMESASPN